MLRALLLSISLVLTLAPAIAAQMDATDSDTVSKRPVIPSASPRQFFISGKVVLEDGTPPPSRVELQTVCNGSRLTQAHTDSHGSFSFSLSSAGGANQAETQSAASGTELSWTGPLAPRMSESNWQACDLEAALAGFTSEKVALGRRTDDFGENNIGQIVLHRTEQVDGLTISVTGVVAPERAKKAFRKGLGQEKKNNWDEARVWFEKSVEIYPKYAVAWFELGRVRMQRNEGADAVRCWEQASAADPKYLPPYQMLAQVAAGEGHWQELVKATQQWLTLDPVDFPDAWYLNAVGNYSLGKLPAAEDSARQGIKLDQRHRVPKLQYVLGIILMRRQAYSEAEETMQAYLHLVNKPGDVDEARKQLAEIERLSASANFASSGEKH